ncbi:MAG: LysM peptidoglycan-binding domain-containing protein [Oligoflexia bacterium]|nr:LysM peptidoglycan-binding domain-containing protein [Oligoflexia bacterium]
MQRTLTLLTMTLFLVTGCASKNVIPNPDGSSATVEEAAENKVIQKLPTTKTDLGATDSIDKIDVTFNEETEKWVEYFQGRGRGHFERYMERSTKYIPMMKKILRENGVPEDLIYIAMIESGFTGKIKSRAKAVGYWQFMPGTGKHYGLKANSLMDERWDPVRSTEAAAAYFKGLYNLFGSWFLAIASYNVGENRIKSLVMKNYTRDFWELAKRKQLPNETIHYVPKFLAARQIALEPEKYGFMGLDYKSPMVFDVITAKDPVDMKALAKAMRIEYDEIKDLNPAYKTQYIPVIGDVATIRVPQGTGEAAKIAVSEAIVKNKRFLAQAEAPSKLSFLRYKVRRGDTLDKIAETHDTTVDELLKVNRIRKNKVKPGITLKIPTSAFNIDKMPRVFHAAKSNSQNKNRYVPSLTYVVKRGDTLTQIARRHKVSVNDIMKKNRLAQNKVQRGQKLVIPRTSQDNS